MSRKVATLVYAKQAGSMARKAVLAYFADRANDDGTGIWASKQRIADEIECSKQTVITTVKALLADGLLIETGKRANSNGYTVEYAMNLAAIEALPDSKRDSEGVQFLTGQNLDQSSSLTARGQAALPKPSMNRPEEEANASPSSRAKPKTIIPEDWEAPSVQDLPPKARACAEQWTQASYDTHAEAFKLYWRSERKLKGDWNGTWGNRIIALHSQVMRDQKYGNAPTDTPASGSAFNMDEYRERMARLEGRGFAGDARHVAPTGPPRAGKPQTLADVINQRIAQGSA